MLAVRCPRCLHAWTPLDFGLACPIDPDAVKTRTGAVLGTPAYMSPEQAAGGKNVDARADLFSLGAVLSEMLTGRRAFTGDNWMEVLSNRLTTTLPPPHAVNAAVPAEVSALVGQLLAQAPAQRPASAVQVARRLKALAEPPAESLHTSRVAPAPPAPGRLRWAPLVVLGLALPLAVAVWALWPGPKGRDEGPAGPPRGDRPAPVSAAAFAAAWQTAVADDISQRQQARDAQEERRRNQVAGVVALVGQTWWGQIAVGEALGHVAAFDGLFPDVALPQPERPALLDSTGGEVPKEKVQELQRGWARSLRVPAETSIDLDGGVKLELVLVPPGRFLMGSPDGEKERTLDELQHAVELTRPFYAGRFAVTQEQFQSLLGRNPSFFQKGRGGEKWFEDGWGGNRRLPVGSVTWYDAVELCNRLSSKQGLRPCSRLTGVKQGSDGEITEATVEIVEGANGYRLPTEAEWEYACRAGTRSPFSFGDALNGDRANCDGRYPYGTDRKGTYLGRPQPVGSYEPNALGLFDMHGNVYQWCQDWYDKDSYRSKDAAKDPRGPGPAKPASCVAAPGT
jgi:formylglycine-generating enzyme required for sulfatase activity